MTHFVDSSLRPEEIATEYLRPFSLEGDRLVLRYTVENDEGGKAIRIVSWRRLEKLR